MIPFFRRLAWQLSVALSVGWMKYELVKNKDLTSSSQRSLDNTDQSTRLYQLVTVELNVNLGVAEYVINSCFHSHYIALVGQKTYFFYLALFCISNLLSVCVCLPRFHIDCWLPTSVIVTSFALKIIWQPVDCYWLALLTFPRERKKVQIESFDRIGRFIFSRIFDWCWLLF